MASEKYAGRITSEHRVRPKFMAWLASNLNKVEDTAALYRQMDDAFDIELAQGKQLDTLGEIVGVDRLLNFEPVYAAPLLSDAYYRMVLRAKISLNQWDGTIQGIKELWDNIFDGYQVEIVDWQDMSMTLRVINLNSLFESEFISRGYLAPKPESVRVNYEFVLTRTMNAMLYTGGKLAQAIGSGMLQSHQAAFQLKDGAVQAGGGMWSYLVCSLPEPKERGA